MHGDLAAQVVKNTAPCEIRLQGLEPRRERAVVGIHRLAPHVEMAQDAVARAPGLCCAGRGRRHGGVFRGPEGADLVVGCVGPPDHVGEHQNTAGTQERQPVRKRLFHAEDIGAALGPDHVPRTRWGRDCGHVDVLHFDPVIEAAHRDPRPEFAQRDLGGVGGRDPGCARFRQRPRRHAGAAADLEDRLGRERHHRQRPARRLGRSRAPPVEVGEHLHEPGHVGVVGVHVLGDQRDQLRLRVGKPL